MDFLRSQRERRVPHFNEIRVAKGKKGANFNESRVAKGGFGLSKLNLNYVF